ncbi:hypothetical protein [Agathobacter sp.]
MIFTILKVIGIILLILFGLLLFVILSVLFVPIRYSGRGSFDNTDVHAELSAGWFLHLFVLKLHYDNELDGYYRLAFIKRRLFEPEEPDDGMEPDGDEDIDRMQESAINEDEIISDDSQPAGQVLYTASSAEDENDCKADERNDNDSTKKKHKKYKSNKKESGDGILNKVTGVINKFKKLYSDSRNKAAIGHLKEEFFIILKRICPKKLVLTAEFSTGEPDKTGILLGILAMFPIGYTNRWQITPDFNSDEAFAKGSFKIKGRIFIISILAASLRILFDKNCRRLYNKIIG